MRMPLGLRANAQELWSRHRKNCAKSELEVKHWSNILKKSCAPAAVIEAVKVATTTARGRGARAWRRAMLQRLSDPGLRVKLGVVRVTVVR